MRKIFAVLAAFIIAANAFAQSPEKMSYQAVIRNSSDALVTNTQVGMQISILQGSPTGTVVYSETQTPTTNANGLVSIEIGGGAGFSSIDWSTGPYFIKTETDPTGGTAYTITGTSQLLSVPYALHAKTAESISGTITETDPVFGASAAGGINSTDITNWNNKLDTEVDGSITNEIQVLSIAHDTVFLSNGGFVKLPTGFDGQYSSLTGAPTNVSIFTNDAGYLTTEVDGSITNEIQVLSIAHDTVFLSNGGFVKLPAGFDGQYSSLAGAPTNVSTFTNDAGYLTSYTETDPQVGSNVTGYSPQWNGSALVTGSIYQNAAGHVGIGTNNPVAILDINGIDGVVRFKNTYDQIGGVLINTFDAVQLGMFNPTGSNVNQLPAGSGRSFFGFDATGKVGSLTNYFLANTYRNLLDDGNGNAGIGTTTPAYKLDVNGDVNVSGTYRVNGSALATVAKTGSYNDLTNKPTILDAADGSETIVTAGTNITVTGSGTTTNPYVINSANSYFLGELYGGGVVFYIDHTGQHGLVCSMIDLSTGQIWSDVTATLIGETAQSDWDGLANSNAIVGQSGHTSSASKLCLDYINADYGTGVYSDWYLPSYDELAKLFQAKYEVNKSLSNDGNGLTTALYIVNYWSSTEFNSGNAWAFGFHSGNAANISKSFAIYVRAIRAF